MVAFAVVASFIARFVCLWADCLHVICISRIGRSKTRKQWETRSKINCCKFSRKKNLTEKKGRKREHREIFNERNLWKFVFVHCFVVFVLPIRQLQKLLNRLLAL